MINDAPGRSSHDGWRKNRRARNRSLLRRDRALPAARAETKQILDSTLDSERIFEFGRAADFGQARARLLRAPCCEKMASCLVALGGGQHERGLGENKLFRA